MSKPTKKWTEQDLFELIRAHYPESRYAVLSQVQSASGFNDGTSTADAVVMDCWPSGGLAMYGFEIKCSLADLKKEISNPYKAERFAQYCNYWYLVLAERKWMDKVAIPEDWGVMVPARGGKSLEQVKTPINREYPKDINRPLLASILRNAMRQESFEARMKQEYERGRLAGMDSERQSLEQEREHLDAVKEKAYAAEREYWQKIHLLFGNPKDLNEQARRVELLAAILSDSDRLLFGLKSNTRNMADDLESLYNLLPGWIGRIRETVEQVKIFEDAVRRGKTHDMR